MGRFYHDLSINGLVTIPEERLQWYKQVRMNCMAVIPVPSETTVTNDSLRPLLSPLGNQRIAPIEIGYLQLFRPCGSTTGPPLCLAQAYSVIAIKLKRFQFYKARGHDLTIKPLTGWMRRAWICASGLAIIRRSGRNRPKGGMGPKALKTSSRGAEEATIFFSRLSSEIPRSRSMRPDPDQTSVASLPLPTGGVRCASFSARSLLRNGFVRRGRSGAMPSTSA